MDVNAPGVPNTVSVIAKGGVATVRVVVDVPGILLKSAVNGFEPTNKLLPLMPALKATPASKGEPNKASQSAPLAVTANAVPWVAS